MTTDPDISKYFSELSKKRKKPYTPFRDKDYAKAMGQKSGKVRRARADKKTTKSQDSVEGESSKA